MVSIIQKAPSISLCEGACFFNGRRFFLNAVRSRFLTLFVRFLNVGRSFSSCVMLVILIVDACFVLNSLKNVPIVKNSLSCLGFRSFPFALSQKRDKFAAENNIV